MKPLESLLHSFVELHPEDAARAFESLETGEAVRLFGSLREKVAANLAERLAPNIAGPVFEKLNPEHAPRLLSELPPSTGRQLRGLAAYPQETAGAMMEPRVASFAFDPSVERATSAIRSAPRSALHYSYVTKRDGSMAGVLNMRDLLLASPHEKFEPLAKCNVLTIAAAMSSDEVVDLDGRLIGVVKHDEVLETGQLEAFEDLQKMVGVGSDERALSPVSTVVRRRLTWLIVDLLTAFMASAVVGLFEATIAQVAGLAVQLPVVSGQSGNSGAQSLAIVMRGLALREILSSNQRRVILRTGAAITSRTETVEFVSGTALAAGDVT